MTVSGEHEDHRKMKYDVNSVLMSCEWITRFDDLHADIAAFLPGRRGVAAIECEQRCNAYWIRRNAMRNDRNGCDLNVMVTPSEKIAEKIRAVIGTMPERIRMKTVVVRIEEFTPEFVRRVMERRA